MAAAAFTIGTTVEESTAALMACRGASTGGMSLSEQLDALVAAAVVATEQTSAGATAHMATRAGTTAAASVAAGATLEEVQTAARESIPEIPGWSLESWLASLSFDKLVSEAILKRVREAVPKGQSLRAYEQAFVVKLGEHGQVDTIMALLKETPVLRLIAEAICGQAQSLVAELQEARLEAERAKALADAEEARVRQAREALDARRRASSTSRRRWTRANMHRTTAGTGRNLTLAGTAKDVKMSAEELNAEAVKKGAFTLSYSTDASLYWNGLTRLTGPPGSQLEKPVMAWMDDEHCNSIDSDETFEVGNYGTATTSRAEWLFVVSPDTGLDILDLDDWPGAEEARTSPGRAERKPHSLEDFRSEWDSVDKRLVAGGEQPLSDVEFIALRLYTGPLFRKYNAVLRSKCGVKFLELVFNEVCLGNTYATTIHVLSSAIIKLGKIVHADLVYRAPGGALPNSFWHKQPEGMQGGLELAFMSTTTAKKEAMAYARRAPGMILFEIQQGFVARGASISWLSQYPDEEEILFPPLTSLEVCGTKVEGAVLIVQLRPSMKAPDTLKTGSHDIEEMKRLREEHEQEIKAAHDRAESEKQRAAREMSVKQRQMAWQSKMMDVRLAASQRQSAAVQSKLALEKKQNIATALAGAVTKESKRSLAESLQFAETELEKTKEAQKVAEAKAAAAAENEERALAAKKDAERRLDVSNWKLTAKYSEAQFMKGLLRAKEAALLRANMDGPAPVQEEKPPPEPVRVPIDHGPLGDIGADEAVRRLAEVVGEVSSWPRLGIQPEDVQFIHSCCDKIIALSGSKKSRKAAAQASVFEHIGKMMKRYESDQHLIIKGLSVLAACARKAEGDKTQGEAGACLVSVIESMDCLLGDAYEAIQGITRNHRENTVKMVRTGGRVDWLDPDSNVVPPDQGPISPVKRKSKSAAAA